MSAFFGKLLYDLTLDQHCRCFEDQGEGAADLLEALGRWQDLEDMDFRRCSKIPAAAWQQLRGAKWPRLRKANFGGCLARERNRYSGHESMRWGRRISEMDDWDDQVQIVQWHGSA